uniref:interferon-stimulated 20 kDa exonuclease-like 2 n=1 Tax=Lonchura striata TaxID=40157 RepID=UPI000B4DEB83|nr:interferon-stimulated 20 kDa exonuclease-like 2 [Lonchura striata domestica]
MTSRGCYTTTTTPPASRTAALTPPPAAAAPGAAEFPPRRARMTSLPVPDGRVFHGNFRFRGAEVRVGPGGVCGTVPKAQGLSPLPHGAAPVLGGVAEASHGAGLAVLGAHPPAPPQVLRILAGKVVVGHAIHNDFKALHYCHPRALTRDTAQIPLLNRRAGFPENVAVSLKRLTKALLNQDIQVGKSGHSSVEDARATMELYKVVEEEWEQHLQQNPEQK